MKVSSHSYLNKTLFLLFILCIFTGNHCKRIRKGEIYSLTETVYKQFLNQPFKNSFTHSLPTASSSSSPSPPIYNRSLALFLVEHAAAAYTADFSSLVGWTCPHCTNKLNNFQFVDLIIDADRLLLAYVGVQKELNSIIVSFRGTKEKIFLNWMADLYFFPLNLSYPGVKNAFVHYGFYYAYHNTTLRERITSNIFSILKNDSNLKLSVTGHSLGAAMAALCALDLTVNFGFRDVDVITFGQPRVGNAVFANFFNEKLPRSIRMTHGHDIVVHLPPKTFRGNYAYHHVATEVWIHKDPLSIDWPSETEKVCDSSGEDRTCSRSVRGTSVKDHFFYLGVDICMVEEYKKSNWRHGGDKERSKGLQRAII